MKNKNDYTNSKYSLDRNEKGFSLLEVLIALVILALGLLALGNMQVMGIGGNASGQKMTTAATLAQDALEGLINLPYNTLDIRAPIDGTYGNFDTDFPEYNNGVAGASKTFMGVAYVRTYRVDRDYPIAGQTMTIEAAVTWNDQSGNPHSVTTASVRRR